MHACMNLMLLQKKMDDSTSKHALEKKVLFTCLRESDGY
jgi:hypothetical protein